MPKILSAVLILLVYSCGIEEIPYLENPPTPNYTSEESINLSQGGKILLTIPGAYLGRNDGFQGFDIYYKIQADENVGATASLDSDQTSLNSTSDGIQPSVLKLKRLNYSLLSVLNSSDSTSSIHNSPSPIISFEEFESDKDYKILLDFSSFYELSTPAAERPTLIPSLKIYDASADIAASPEVTLAKYSIYRGVRDKLSDKFKSFGELFDPAVRRAENLEPNLTGANSEVLNQKDYLEILFFIVGVGYDNVTFETLETTPVPIGIISRLYIKNE